MKIVIESPVVHDGKALELGAVADLPKEAAEALVAAGVASVPVVKAAKAVKVEG